MQAYDTRKKNELILCEQWITSFGGALRRPSLRYPPFCDEKRKKSTKLGLLSEQVDSHETRTKELRGMIQYLSSN